MTDPSALPPGAVIIRSTVADFDTWLRVFDESEDLRRESGLAGHHVNRSVDNPNELSVYLAVSDLDAAHAFTESDELRERMAKAGVTGPPEMMWVTPLREEIVWDRELPAFILSHEVADLDAWLEGYDGADELRTSNGIVGHAANQSVDNPSVTVVYHQAESIEALQAFLANPALKAVMEAAGVTSEPEVSFHTGGWGKSYA